MSNATPSLSTSHGRGKKKNSKRPATSPLNDTERACKTASTQGSTQGTQGGGVHDNNNTTVSSQPDRNRFQTQIDNIITPVNMAFQQQYGAYGCGGNIPGPGMNNFNVSSPGYIHTSPTFQGTQIPDWAIAIQNDIKAFQSAIQNDVKAIKSEVMKIEGIEKSVSQINLKLCDLETNIGSIVKRLQTVETSCAFISSQHDDHKKELESTKSEMSSLKRTCEGLEAKTRVLEGERKSLEGKIVDLEFRSMRDNLMFYGIAEKDGEDCEAEVKLMIAEKLQYQDAGQLTFDRVHRVGRRLGGKTRPIVAKFHYYNEREKVRTKSFECNDALKTAGMGVGIQMPKEVRDARRGLQEVARQERAKGRAVKFVRDRLYVDGRPFEPPEGGSAAAPPRQSPATRP